MAVLGLHLCARALSSRGKRGPLPIAMRGPLTIAASPAAEHRLQTRRPSNCGPRAQPPRGMRDPPRPGPEPVSPAPAGRLPTTAPPGKPENLILINTFTCIQKPLCFEIGSCITVKEQSSTKKYTIMICIIFHFIPSHVTR